MTARRQTAPIVVTAEQKRFSGVLSGPVRAVHPAIREVGCPWTYDPRTHAYSVPRQHLDDVLVRLELAGVRVDLRMAARGVENADGVTA